MRMNPLGLAMSCLLVGVAAGWWMSGEWDRVYMPPTVSRPQTGAAEALSEQVRSPSVESIEPRIVRPVSNSPLAASTGASEDTAQGDADPLNAAYYEQAPETKIDRADEWDARTGPGLEEDDDEAARRRQEDFEAYNDGPVIYVEGTDPDPEGKAEPLEEGDTCLLLGSPGCRKDRDCCGSLVCRSRPGTISGFWECTAG